MELLVASIVAFAVGVAGACVVFRATHRTKVAVGNERIHNLERRLAEEKSAGEKIKLELSSREATLLATSKDLSAARAELMKEKEASAEKLALVQQSEQRLSESFDLLAAKALKENAASFLELAKNQFEQEQKSATGELGAKKEAIESLLATAGRS